MHCPLCCHDPVNFPTVGLIKEHLILSYIHFWLVWFQLSASSFKRFKAATAIGDRFKNPLVTKHPSKSKLPSQTSDSAVKRRIRRFLIIQDESDASDWGCLATASRQERVWRMNSASNGPLVDCVTAGWSPAGRFCLFPETSFSFPDFRHNDRLCSGTSQAAHLKPRSLRLSARTHTHVRSFRSLYWVTSGSWVSCFGLPLPESGLAFPSTLHAVTGQILRPQSLQHTLALQACRFPPVDIKWAV